MKKLLSLALLCALLCLSLASAASAATFSHSSQAPSYTGGNAGAVITFSKGKFYGGQTFPVYSGPGYEYYRAAGGWAKMSTDEASYVAGREGDWILVMYPLSGGGYRVGYVDRTQLHYTYRIGELSLAYVSATITQDCSLTQDPLSAAPATLANVSRGEQVTYLAEFRDKRDYAFVELLVEGQWVRGFVPSSCVSY
ncbi:MAG: hypothetical protein ACI4PG_03310 [Candidatus Ventricola sp.]